MIIELEKKTQYLLKHLLVNLRKPPQPPSSPKIVKMHVHKGHEKKEAILTAETEKALAKIKKPSRSLHSPQQGLSTETEQILNTIHKPSKKAHKKKEATLTTETEKALAKIKKPSHSRRQSRQKQGLSTETEQILNTIHKPSKKAHKKKETTLTTETEKALTKIKKPSDHKDSICEKIIYNIEVGVLYDDIAKLMSDNDVSWSDIKKNTINAVPTAPVVAQIKQQKYTKTPFSRTVLQLCMYTVDNILDALNSDIENVLAPEILDVLMYSVKTTINPTLYGACIKKSVPGLNLVTLSNHLLELFNRLNFLELFTLLVERIPYLTSVDRIELLTMVLKRFITALWNTRMSSYVPIDALPDYITAIRGLRFTENGLEDLATNDGHMDAFKHVHDFELDWTTMTKDFKPMVMGLTHPNPMTLKLTTSKELKTLEEYKRHKMICEGLYRSGDERGIVPKMMELYICLDPKKIKKEVLSINLQIEDFQLEVGKIERWWHTVIHRPINFEEEEGNVFILTPLYATVVPPSAPPPSPAENNEAQLIERLDKLMKVLGPLYLNVQYLDIRLRICSTYYNLEDCTLDVELVKGLISKAVNYNNILKHFKKMAKEKIRQSEKRKTRDTNIKRDENNSITAALNRETEAINANTLQIEKSLTDQTTTLSKYQAFLAGEFQHVESKRKESAKLSRTTARAIHVKMDTDIKAAVGSAAAAVVAAKNAADEAAAVKIKVIQMVAANRKIN